MSNSKPITALPLLCLLLLCAGSSASAQQLYETQIVALLNRGSPQPTPIVLEAPYPFVEVSRSLPEIFAQHRNVSSANRLIAWFIPRLALKDHLNEKTERPRSLRVQVQKSMEPVRYSAADLKQLREDGTQGRAVITEDNVETFFTVMDLTQFKKQGVQKILGTADLGPDSFTLCVATSAEGRDLRGGRQIEPTISCVTHILLNEKILLLTVSGPEISAPELANTMRLTREWIQLLRDANNIPALGAQPPTAQSATGSAGVPPADVGRPDPRSIQNPKSQIQNPTAPPASLQPTPAKKR